ncbi:ABC transporter substrate-binding protein [Rothia nasisuis]|uniref:ABC transporter substrate-binding protein n=1 Tax=Rothia nasisuis TaxID=2109647 RepID=UPI001F3495BD|nr:ABC transporter substrate-binding protein [Rothia nasisuis]
MTVEPAKRVDATGAVTRRAALSWGAALAAGLALTACSSSPSAQKPAPAGAATETPDPFTFRFAQSAQILSLDPAYTTRLESHRISAQILEPLVRADVNTGEPVAALAREWSISDDGLTYTFTLNEDVTFSDGTAFTAQAITANFDRWARLGRQELTHITQPFHLLFGSLPQQEGAGGTTEPELKPLVTQWEAADATTVRVQLERPSRSFLKVLTQPAYGIVLPSLMTSSGPLSSHPVGTGAFALESWEEQTVTLTRHTGYRGKAPQVERLVFTTVPDPEKRYYNLLQGKIDAYDQVALKDYVPLALDGYAVQSRDPYAITYLGLNLSHPAFADLRTRQALACSIDRSALSGTYYPQGTNTASDFLPALFQMKNEDMGQPYRYNLERAKELLAASEYQGDSIDFYYPTNLSLPSLPSPEAIYSMVAADLVEAGFTIVPKPYRWDDEGSEDIASSHPDFGLELTGFVGAYRDPTAFLGRILAPAATAPASISQTPASSESTSSPSPSPTSSDTQTGVSTTSYGTITRAIAEADTLTDIGAWRDAYRSINEDIAELMPAVPLFYPVSGVSQGERVISYTVSATCIDDFATVALNT